MQRRPDGQSRESDRPGDRQSRQRPTARPTPRRDSAGWRFPRIDDRILLGGVLLVLGASLVIFATLVVSGASRLGGDGSANDDLQIAANDLPTAIVNPVVAATPTPAVPNPTADAPAAPSVTPTAVPDAPAVASGDRPIVCIDVGHGGADLGNVRTDASDSKILTMEKDITLGQGLTLRDRLEAQGIDVVMTRTTDTLVDASLADVNGDGNTANDVNGDGEIVEGEGDYPDQLDELQARVNICNDAGAELLISIHVNSSENRSLQGVEAYWADDAESAYEKESSQFAIAAVKDLEQQFAAVGFEPDGRGAAPDSSVIDPDDDPATFDHYVMLSPDKPERNFVGAKMPTVIVECLFLSNDDDYAFITDDPEKAQNAIVTAYDEAIVAFFGDRVPNSGGGAAPAPTSEAGA